MDEDEKWIVTLGLILMVMLGVMIGATHQAAVDKERFRECEQKPAYDIEIDVEVRGMNVKLFCITDSKILKVR